jgi:RNA polymerase sigma-70 factor, sigma-B/F/G subfamily
MNVKVNRTIELINLAKLGDDNAKDIVVKENLGLVWSIVHRFKNNFYDKEDLFQIGCVGLIKAINNFNDSYNVQFSTYAVPIIMGEIKRHFRDDGTIKVSRSLKELNLRIQKAKESLFLLLDREPTLYDVADYLKEDPQDIILAQDASYYPTSLNEPIYQKDGSSIYMEDRIEDLKNKMWFEKMALEMEIAKLDEKEKLIITMRYFNDCNQDKVAKRLGISQVQVSRLEKKIIQKLKDRLLNEMN